MAYQVLIEHEGKWKPYGREVETMGRAHKAMQMLMLKRPWRKWKVVNLVNYEVEKWTGRQVESEAGHEGE